MVLASFSGALSGVCTSRHVQLYARAATHSMCLRHRGLLRVPYSVRETLQLKSEITTILTAFVIASIGNLYAHTTKRPSLIPTIGGICYLVPGGMGVRGALVSIGGGLGSGNGLSLTVFSVALSIATGVFLASAIVLPRAKKTTLGSLRL